MFNRQREQPTLKNKTGIATETWDDVTLVSEQSLDQVEHQLSKFAYHNSMERIGSNLTERQLKTHDNPMYQQLVPIGKYDNLCTNN